MKPKIDSSTKVRAKSPPVRGCGLKPECIGGEWSGSGVTPRAGVWIETGDRPAESLRAFVTPRAGVWIETETNERYRLKEYSHPPCGGVD